MIYSTDKQTPFCISLTLANSEWYCIVYTVLQEAHSLCVSALRKMGMEENKELIIYVVLLCAGVLQNWFDAVL